MFQKALPIWLTKSQNEVNEYGEFVLSFDVPKTKGRTVLRISSSSEYEAKVDSVLVGFGQYPNFADEKFVDEIDLTGILEEGRHELRITALSKNYPTSSSIADGKWVVFEVVNDGETLAYSSPSTLSRIHPRYLSGKIPYITSQLGMGYRYSFVASDDIPYSPSIALPAFHKYSPRPTKKLDTATVHPFTEVKDFLFDAGKEVVGYLTFDIDSKIEQEMILSYGEHIADGKVRRLIGDRDFSLRFTLKKGRNRFFGPFLRLGLRYLELSPIKGKAVSIGVVRATYPHVRLPMDFGSLQSLVEKSLYTVECCMHEHYEDCPWREAAQYTMDARIEMLVTMLGFGEYEFPRACLLQMSHDFTPQGTLRITTPSNSSLSIPTYSLIYFRMVLEYFEISKDRSLLQEVDGKLLALLSHYEQEEVDGLLPHLREWNFYEWAEGLHFDHEIHEQKKDEGQFDFILNAFYLIAVDSYASICSILGKPNEPYLQKAEALRTKIHEKFFGPNHLYYSFYKKEGYHYSEFANWLALYARIAPKEKEEAMLRILTEPNDCVPLTLCNYIFKYDVLLRHEGYRDYIVEDLTRVWGEMDSRGASTYWETIRGEADFSGAGSLCHGWSAVPAYILLQIRNIDVKKGGSYER
ncbi:MAG: family 78 glycoside hydrolase catalytic domain [Candidatus Enteromonas sp.]|nr:family 78 glycoside hydrolase catalytic domain [Candidatus Enteromonas sp.]